MKACMTGNYLDLIPEKCESILYEMSDNELVTLEIRNKGFFDSIAQKFFKKPKVSYIHLDEIGSFVWGNINGENTVYEISLLIKERFGDSAEPLFNRLVWYVKAMEEYGFICMR